MTENLDSFDNAEDQEAESEVLGALEDIEFETESRISTLAGEISASGLENEIENDTAESRSNTDLILEVREGIENCDTVEEKRKYLERSVQENQNKIQTEDTSIALETRLEIWETEEAAEKNADKFNQALSEWQDESDTIGIAGFAIEYNAEDTTDERRAEIEEGFIEQGFTREEFNKFVKTASGQLGVEYQQRVERRRDMEQALSSVENFEAVMTGFDQANIQNDEDLDAFLNTRFEELAKTDQSFRDYLDQKAGRIQVIEAMEQALVLREATETPPQTLEEVTHILEVTNTLDQFSSLDASTQASVENIIRNGGATVMTTMLSNNIKETSTGYESVVSGATVELRKSDGNLYIVGEHAYDVANRGKYKIDPPSPAGFDQTFLRMIVDQNEVASMAEPGLHNVLLGIAEKFGDDARDNTLMHEDEANRFHNFIQLMLGEDNIEASVEIQRLQDLGIIDTTESGGVDQQRLDRIHRAMVEYVPTATDNIRLHELGMDYKHFQTLADLWNYTGDDTILPSADKLKQLTERLPEDIIERNEALLRFCEEEGYILD